MGACGGCIEANLGCMGVSVGCMCAMVGCLGNGGYCRMYRGLIKAV